MAATVCIGTHPAFGMSLSWQEPPSFEPVPKFYPALVLLAWHLWSVATSLPRMQWGWMGSGDVKQDI